MKLLFTRTRSRQTTGILLVECVVYIAVFAILTAVGFGAFYVCWDNTQAVIRHTDDIGAALRAGEGWRADVRNATGKITVEQSAAGESVRIPGPKRAVVYHFESGEVRREIPSLQTSSLLLPKVKSSQITEDLRDGVTAWRWELELRETHSHINVPLSFTFEAAQSKP